MPGGKRTWRSRGKQKVRDSTQRSQSTSSIDTSSSAFDDSSELNLSLKKQKTAKPYVSTPKSGSIRSHFSPVAIVRSRQATVNMNAEAKIHEDGPSAGLNQSDILPQENYTNTDLMRKLCRNGDQLENVSRIVEELRGEIFALKQDNDQLKKEVEEGRKREEALRDEVKLATHRATLADDRSHFLEQYSRNYNLRLYFVKEPVDETASQCEQTVLKLFHNELGLTNITSDHLDAVHRLGPKKESNKAPRGIIVRFISRKTRDEVIANRRKLKSKNGIKSAVIAEDLTQRNYHLFTWVRSAEVAESCWTKRGKIFVKANSGFIKEIKKKSDLQDARLVPRSSNVNERNETSSATDRGENHEENSKYNAPPMSDTERPDGEENEQFEKWG